MCLAKCLVLLCVNFVKVSLTQNIETRSATLVRPQDSLKQNFGASIVVANDGPPILFYVGAPKAGYTPKSSSPGAVYRCPLDDSSAGEKLCGNKIETGKSGALGLSMTNIINSQDVVACAPKYNYSRRCSNEQWMVGSCLKVGTEAQELSNPCLPGSCPFFVDMIFVVDQSGSVGINNFQAGLDWITVVLERFRQQIDAGDVRVGVVKFSTSAYVAIPIGYKTFEELKTQVENIDFGGGKTYTANAINLAVQEFTTKTESSDQIPRLMIVMTDGEAHESEKIPSSSMAAKAEGITMVAVGIGGNVNKDELREIAGGNEDHVLEVAGFDSLNNILDSLTQVIDETATVQLESSVGNETSEFSNCMLGFSTSTNQNGHLFVGAVGAFDRAGSFANYNSPDDSAAGLLGLTGLEVIMSPENITHLRESYLGYSTTSGRFLNGSTEFIVSGSPRYHSRGQVLIMVSSETQSPSTFYYSLHLHGPLWQLGAYFGQSVLAMDTNGDSYDDLLVSAPLFSDNVGYDHGRVFVYMNNPKNPGPSQWVNSTYVPMMLVGNNVNTARFGLSMATPGDVDLNGYDDVIIGAPGESLTSSGSGAVYVYYSSAQGLSNSYKQRIEGSSVAPSLVNFGYSFGIGPSQGTDVDNNHYPDLWMGAASSDTVVILRARPVIDVSCKVRVHRPVIDVTTCINDITMPCAAFQTCLNANTRDHSSFDGFDMVTTLTLDSLSNSIDGSRIVLIGNASISARQFVTSTETCRNYSVRINAPEFLRIGGLTTPIRVTYSYDFSSQHKAQVMSPVTDTLGKNFAYADWTIYNGCQGNNYTCKGDLALKVSYSIPQSSQAYVIKSSENVFSLAVTISNHGPDPAFSVRLEITSLSIGVSQILSTCADIFPSESGNRKTVIVLKSPISLLSSGDQCKVEILYALQSLTRRATVDKLAIHGELLSGYEKHTDTNKFNNDFNYERSIKYDVNLAVTSQSPSYTVFFQSNQLTSRNTIQSIMDPVFPAPIIHTFRIYNKGSQLLSSGGLTFQWTDMTLDGFQLLYLYHFTCLPAAKCVCNLNTAVNKLGIPLTNDTRFSHQLRFPPIEAKPIPLKPNCTNVKCQTILCHVTDLTAFTSVVVEARFVLWAPSFTGNNVESSPTSSVMLNISSSPVYPMKNYVALASTTIKANKSPDALPQSRDTSDILAILGAILGGVALLSIVVLVCWKIGFFNSKYKDKLVEAQQVDETPTIVEDIEEEKNKD